MRKSCKKTMPACAERHQIKVKFVETLYLDCSCEDLFKIVARLSHTL